MVGITIASTLGNGASNLLTDVIASVAALPPTALVAALVTFMLGVSGIVVARTLGNPGSPGSAKQGGTAVAADPETMWLAELREAA